MQTITKSLYIGFGAALVLSGLIATTANAAPFTPVVADPQHLTADADGDGFYRAPPVDLNGDKVMDEKDINVEVLDCDDTNPKVHPNATEIVGNDVDENCDGVAMQFPVDADTLALYKKHWREDTGLRWEDVGFVLNYERLTKGDDKALVTLDDENGRVIPADDYLVRDLITGDRPVTGEWSDVTITPDGLLEVLKVSEVTYLETHRRAQRSVNMWQVRQELARVQEDLSGVDTQLRKDMEDADQALAGRVDDLDSDLDETNKLVTDLSGTLTGLSDKFTAFVRGQESTNAALRKDVDKAQSDASRALGRQFYIEGYGTAGSSWGLEVVDGEQNVRSDQFVGNGLGTQFGLDAEKFRCGLFMDVMSGSDNAAEGTSATDWAVGVEYARQLGHSPVHLGGHAMFSQRLTMVNELETSVRGRRPAMVGASLVIPFLNTKSGFHVTAFARGAVGREFVGATDVFGGVVHDSDTAYRLNGGLAIGFGSPKVSASSDPAPVEQPDDEADAAGPNS